MPVPPRYGSAVLQPGRYSSRHFGPAAKASGRKEPSGQPGSSRDGCWRRQCQSSRRKFLTVGPALPACCQPQTARRFRINGVVVYSYSTGTARERGGVYPARTSSCAHSFGPFRPRPVRPSVHPQRRSLPLFQGAQGLPSTALQSPPPQRCKTASPATLHFVPRPWSLGDSKPGSPHQGQHTTDRRHPLHRPVLETPSNQGQPGISRPSHGA